jgi:hypothetical protein
MTMISYARNREDVRLARVLTDADGFFIDVRADGPAWHSVTRHFYERGWRGIHVEPRAPIADALRRERARDITVEATLAPVANAGGNDASTGTTGAAAVTTLAAVCEQHGVAAIDVLSIEARGDERSALAGHDWQRWRPRVVVVEAMPLSTIESTHASWEPLLLQARYRFAAFDGLNRFYVREEDAHLVDPLARPVSVRDAYQPYEYVREIERLREAADETPSTSVAARALVEGAQAQIAAVWGEFDHMREQLRRLQTHAAAGERRLLGLRNMAKGLWLVLAPTPRRVEAPHLPAGLRGRVLHVARGLRPLTRRFPRLARLGRRWVYRNGA